MSLLMVIHLTLKIFLTNMKQIILNLLLQKNLEVSKYNLDTLYQAGMNNVMNNIEYYHDKPYTCKSVIKELFERGVIDKIKEAQTK